MSSLVLKTGPGYRHMAETFWWADLTRVSSKQSCAAFGWSMLTLRWFGTQTVQKRLVKKKKHKTYGLQTGNS